jgi:imidazolonepropionase-like amidohydrolase
LHEEAGLSWIKAIQHATGNNARILGMEGQISAVRAGYLADLIVVNGNPLENMKVLYPSEGAGVEWTIKDGIPYGAPTLRRRGARAGTKSLGTELHAEISS